ncbi:MAG: hypothetical protein KDA90_15445 [Planctomycetaceae bacterium]|nr:hypothetical protein [Planctomycetaceae bacterium]
MSIARAEELKRELTNKYVVVQDNIPELKRFQGLTGTVKTVNMSCRALVMFDGPVDIGWYDIDPTYLKVIDEPLPKKKAAAAHAAPAKPAAAPKPAAATGGKSPLELARQQGAAKADGGGKKLSPLELARQQGAAKTADAAGGEKKLSPLELARMQGAAKPVAAPAPEPVAEAAPEPPAPAPVEEAPASAAAPADGARAATPGSTAEILALARQQGPFKG